MVPVPNTKLRYVYATGVRYDPQTTTFRQAIVLFSSDFGDTWVVVSDDPVYQGDFANDFNNPQSAIKCASNVILSITSLNDTSKSYFNIHVGVYGVQDALKQVGTYAIYINQIDKSTGRLRSSWRNIGYPFSIEFDPSVGSKREFGLGDQGSLHFAISGDPSDEDQFFVSGTDQRIRVPNSSINAKMFSARIFRGKLIALT
jgi:hypothetical protein